MTYLHYAREKNSTLKTHLIVPPAKHHTVEPAVGLVDAVIGAIDRVFGIRVGREGFGEDDLFGESAAYDKCVLDGYYSK